MFQYFLILLLQLRPVQTMFKIRRTELMECPDDEEYVLVMTSSLIHVTLPSHSEKDEESASALSSDDAAPAADETGGTRAA